MRRVSRPGLFGVEGASGSSAEGPVAGFFENSPGAHARWAWGFEPSSAVCRPPPPPMKTSGGACRLGLGFWDSVPTPDGPTPLPPIF